MINYENYDVEKIVYESNFQRILLCKNQNEELFYNNIILRERLIELIDKDYYPNSSDNLIAIEETEDRLYIYSKYVNHKRLTEFISNDNLTYKERVILTENLLKKFIELEKYSDIQADSMMSEDNILIDDNQNIIFKNLLIFNQDYDIEASLLMKQASNYMHYIFVGKFIEEFNVSDEIPPDIRRIIKRANSNEYSDIKDLLDAFKNSPTYSLIIPITKENKEIDEDSISENDQNENEKEEKNRYILPIILAVIIVPVIIMLLFNYNKEEQVNPEQDKPTNQTPNEQENNENQESNKPEENLPESILGFYNEEIIKENSDNYAVTDFSKFYDGYYSLKIENKGIENNKYLFAVIDLDSEDYIYLKNREVGISTRFISDKTIEGNWIIEVRKNGEISNITNEKTLLNPNSWNIKQRSLTLGDNDEIKLFFQYKEEANVWIDSIEIDVLK
ncbi:MAG TPA: hypothetical protein DHM42_07290 [Clostridiales bacterium]|nr:hypothetical protein [Clostridiales bacterium]